MSGRLVYHHHVSTIGLNPFGKELSSVTAADLAVLRTTYEGWYVEYKRQRIEPERIARTVASFANQQGGWLFFGIEESKDRTAGAFVGIDDNDLAPLEQAVHDAVRSHVNPHPFFKTHVVHGPCAELGLPDGKGILIVAVLIGLDPPYLHVSGAIYQRLGNSSGPVPVADRSTLERLWERKREARQRHVERVTSRPALSKDFNGSTFVHVIVLPDKLGESGASTNISFSDFATIARQTKMGGLVLDNVFTTSDGYVARMVEHNEASHMLLTWFYAYEGWSRITIPINQNSLDQHGVFAHTFLKGYKYRERFRDLARKNNYERCYLLDLNYLVFALGGMLQKHRAAHARDGRMGPFFAKAHVENMRGRIPYLDTEGCLNFMSIFGIPVVHDDDAYFPPGFEPEAVVELDKEVVDIETDRNVNEYIGDATALFAGIIEALGLPRHVISDSALELLPAVQRLQARTTE